MAPRVGQPPIAAALVAEYSHLGQPRAVAHGRPESAPRPPRSRGLGLGGQRCVTPRQTCPRPNGFGRNLRSKTRWFTGFCNSHQVSHFATFFIDARAEISVAESRFDIKNTTPHPGHAPSLGHRGVLIRSSSLARFAPGFVCVAGKATTAGTDQRRPSWHPPSQGGPGPFGPSPPGCVVRVRGSFCCCKVSTMILPQVHLRKPCYDFSFL